MSSRKGLIKANTIIEPKKSLSIDINIDNDNLWFIEVTDRIHTFKMPCKLDSMTKRFEIQKHSWNVVVLGKWINSDGRNFIKLD